MCMIVDHQLTEYFKTNGPKEFPVYKGLNYNCEMGTFHSPFFHYVWVDGINEPQYYRFTTDYLIKLEGGLHGFLEEGRVGEFLGPTNLVYIPKAHELFKESGRFFAYRAINHYVYTNVSIIMKGKREDIIALGPNKQIAMHRLHFDMGAAQQVVEEIRKGAATGPQFD